MKRREGKEPKSEEASRADSEERRNLPMRLRDTPDCAGAQSEAHRSPDWPEPGREAMDATDATVREISHSTIVCSLIIDGCKEKGEGGWRVDE